MKKVFLSLIIASTFFINSCSTLNTEPEKWWMYENPKVRELLNKAQALMNNKEYDTAITVLNEVLKHDKNIMVSYMFLEDIYTIKKDDEKLMFCYHKILEFPDKEYYNTKIAFLYIKQNNFDKAISYFEKYLVKYPDRPYVLSFVADIYLKINNLDKAEEYAKKSIEKSTLTNYFLENYLTLSNVYYQRKDYTTALDYLDKISMGNQDILKSASILRDKINLEIKPKVITPETIVDNDGQRLIWEVPLSEVKDTTVVLTGKQNPEPYDKNIDKIQYLKNVINADSSLGKDKVKLKIIFLDSEEKQVDWSFGTVSGFYKFTKNSDGQTFLQKNLLLKSASQEIDIEFNDINKMVNTEKMQLEIRIKLPNGRQNLLVSILTPLEGKIISDELMSGSGI